jgi:hypothetical protein
VQQKLNLEEVLKVADGVLCFFLSFLFHVWMWRVA